MRRLAFAGLVSALLVLVAVPMSVTATPERPDNDNGPRPQADASPDRPDHTPRPDRSAGPEDVATAPQAVAVPPVAVPPARPILTVAYQDPGVLGQAPLVIAREAGYFVDAGFDEVRIVQSADPLADVRSGAADLAIIDALAAARASVADEPKPQAVAGFRNYAPDGSYRGDLMVAAPQPSHRRAVDRRRLPQSLHTRPPGPFDPESAMDALSLIETTDLSVGSDVAVDWPASVSVYAPFDGGFGSLDEGGGLGELDAALADGGVELTDLPAFIAGHTLAIAQSELGLPLNPVNDLVGRLGWSRSRWACRPLLTGLPRGRRRRRVLRGRRVR